MELIKALVWLVTATLATCCAIKRDVDDIIPPRHSQGLARRAAKEADFDRFAQFASAAYCPGLYDFDGANAQKAACIANDCRAMGRNATIIARFGEKKSDPIQGFIAKDDVAKLVVISYRGSASARDWLSNANVVLRRTDSSILGLHSCQGYRVHTGFAHALLFTVPKIMQALQDSFGDSSQVTVQGYTLVVTGHSRGGAVAALTGMYLRNRGIPCDVYTYGAPRYGNKRLMDHMKEEPPYFGFTFRITNQRDPVPRSPFNPWYDSFTPEYHFPSGLGAPFNVCLNYDDKSNVCSFGLSPFSLHIGDHMNYFKGFSGCNDDAEHDRELSKAAKDFPAPLESL